MEHKAVKKAKKGLFSIVFGRTALILMLVLIQLIILVGVATILNDYAVYVYGGLKMGTSDGLVHRRKRWRSAQTSIEC